MSLTTYIIVTVVTCLTPGAGVLCTVSAGLMYGIKVLPYAPTGNALGIFLMGVISVAGLGTIIVASPVLYAGVQAAGALFLVYLGWKNWQAGTTILVDKGTIKKENLVNGALKWRLFRNSLLLQATNPMTVIFLLSLMPHFISPTENYVQKSALLLVLFVGICWLVHIGYSFIAAKASHFLTNDKFTVLVIRTSALLFWLLALSVFMKIFHAL